MAEDTLTLYELMFKAEQFCSRVEAAMADAPPDLEEDEELRLKIGQCHNLLAELQKAYNDDELLIRNCSVRANFRYLIVSLLWVAFRARRKIDFRVFRLLVMIESGFTYLLITHH